MNSPKFQFFQLWIIHFVHAFDCIQLSSPSFNASYKKVLKALSTKPAHLTKHIVNDLFIFDEDVMLEQRDISLSYSK